MRLIYSFLYTCAFLVSIPYFVIVGLIRGKYLKTVSERMGNIRCRSDRPSIWIHAVSVGEFLACKSVIKRIREEMNDVPLFVSTTTITGQALAKQVLPGSTFYFPFDWGWTIRKVLRRIQPNLVLVLETEIWPNFLWTLHSEKIPVLLINGRISDRSMKRYSWIQSWLPGFTECWMQTEEDARRMRSLGGQEVTVMGNLKYDFHPPALSQEFSSMVSSWKGNDLLLVAGSTMSGEEKIILEIFERMKKEIHMKLLIAPRHPERFSEVATLISESRIPFALRSQNRFEDESILILDSIGELAGAYQFADVVLIGGTLMETGGGHNPIEPAFFGKAIVAGANFSNLRAIFEEFQKRNAILITSDLAATLNKLLRDPAQRGQLGEAAKTLIEENAGSSEKVMHLLRRYQNVKCLV
jgi:3-deoxy-D-manno-octulosonic-acid transferase